MKTSLPLTAIVLLAVVSTVHAAGPKPGGHRGGNHGHHGHHGHHHGHHHHGRHHHWHHGRHYGPPFGYGPAVDVVTQPFVPIDTEFMFDPLIGEAEVIRSIGEFNRNTSEALINVEEAQRQAIENHQRRVETRYELKRQWRERQNARLSRRRPQAGGEESPRPSEVRLDDDEFNRVTGEIVWPEVLLDPQFADYRIAFEQMFADPTSKESGAGTNLHRDVNELAKYMKEQLKLQIEYMAPADYVAAKKFIDRLCNEAREAETRINSDSAITALK